jgi:hypothetical protein
VIATCPLSTLDRALLQTFGFYSVLFYSMCRRRWNVSIRERRRVGVTLAHLLSEEQMLKWVTWLGDWARFLWDELVASALGDNQQEHMFGVMRRESPFDHRTAVVIRVLRGLVLREKQRCDLALPVGFGTGMHKSEDEVLYTGGDGSGAPTAGEVFTWVVDNYRFLGLEIPDEVVDELQALGVWSVAPEFRVIDDMVFWRPVPRPHAVAMTPRQSRLNPTAAAGFMQRIMSHRMVVRAARVAEDVPDGPWTDAHVDLLRTLVDAAPW